MRLFVTRMARREARSAVGRLGIYMVSIALGVAALVSLHSLRSDVVRSIERESLSLLGADIRIGANRPIPDSIMTWVDSLTDEGVQTSSVTALLSMALAETSGITRLIQIRGVEDGFPFYGSVETDPPGQWGALGSGRALVDPALLVQFDIEVGDSLSLGNTDVQIAGTVAGLPTDVGIQSAAGPRAFIDLATLEATGLVTFGSLVRYQVFLKLPSQVEAWALRDESEALFSATQVGFRTASDQADALTSSADVLGDFLGLVGLAALLLGGVGVGSAVHVYAKSKLTSVAVLRCLGATRQAVFSIYLIQAAWLGAAGSALGVVIGLVIQGFLPGLVEGVLPVSLDSSPSLAAITLGMALGTWVAVVFALLPLLEIRDVPPLAALRHGVKREGTVGRAQKWVMGGLGVTVVGLTVLEAPTPLIGAVFALGLATGAVCLVLVARSLMSLVRRWFPSWAGYTVRQGVSNLFRPGNQTVAVVLAIGFGVLVVGVISQLESNLTRELALEAGPEAPNMLLFDIQAHQEAGVDSLVGRFTEGSFGLTPVVPARIAALDGRPARDILADSSGDAGPPGWALRREYRNTFRSELGGAEELVAGRWWEEGESRSPDQLPRISLEADLAEDLGVGLGSRITWSLGSREIETVVASLRRVDWARFEPNFFVVFEPGVLDGAPRTSMAVARVSSVEERGDFQRALVRTYPNVSVLDLSTVRQTLESILGQVRGAITLLAGFCTLAGLVVMSAAIASTRSQRRKEGALLRTLGAKLRQLRQVVASEYVALGTLAALAGGLLSLLAGFLLTWGLFEMEYRPDWGLAVGIWGVTVLLTVVTGATTGRVGGRVAPLETLRQADGE